jgi:para-nitrobenzyl esterase
LTKPVKVDATCVGDVLLHAPQGRLLGRVTRAPDRPAIHAYKGVPYAVPPVGSRRWRAAEPAPGWTGVRGAQTYGAMCVQRDEFEGSFYYRVHDTPQSEDCLYLNVWTPAAPGDGSSLPVMVWIHGGGFATGAGSFPTYDGANLAAKGAVVVTINYRVGVLGYFTHPEIVAEAGADGVCANFALTDQIEALRWVRDNIAAFGGDPGRVTVFGESAGSHSLSQLMACPLAEGLFHRGIGQSGAYFLPMRHVGKPSWGGPPAEEIGAEFARRIGAPTLAELRDMPCAELVKRWEGELALMDGGGFIVVDGKVFPEEIATVFAEGRQHPVPVIVGATGDEGGGLGELGLVPPLDDPAAYEAEVRARFGALSDQFLQVYPKDTPLSSTFGAFRDDGFGWGMMWWAEAMARAGTPTWLYQFAHIPPGADLPRPVAGGPVMHPPRAFHGCELPYTFNNVGAEVLAETGGVQGLTRPVDVSLADQISDYWVAFAATGVPAAPNLPEWRPYTPAARDYMRFDRGAHPDRDLLPGMLELWTAINAARRVEGGFWWYYNLGLQSAPLKG